MGFPCQEEEDETEITDEEAVEQQIYDLVRYHEVWDKEDGATVAGGILGSATIDEYISPLVDPEAELTAAEQEYMRRGIEERQAKVDAIIRRVQLQKMHEREMLERVCVTLPAPKSYVVWRRREATRKLRRAAIKLEQKVWRRQERDANIRRVLDEEEAREFEEYCAAAQRQREAAREAAEAGEAARAAAEAGEAEEYLAAAAGEAPAPDSAWPAPSPSWPALRSAWRAVDVTMWDGRDSPWNAPGCQWPIGRENAWMTPARRCPPREWPWDAPVDAGPEAVGPSSPEVVEPPTSTGNEALLHDPPPGWNEEEEEDVGEDEVPSAGVYPPVEVHPHGGVNVLRMRAGGENTPRQAQWTPSSPSRQGGGWNAASPPPGRRRHSAGGTGSSSEDTDEPMSDEAEGSWNPPPRRRSRRPALPESDDDDAPRRPRQWGARTSPAPGREREPHQAQPTMRRPAATPKRPRRQKLEYPGIPRRLREENDGPYADNEAGWTAYLDHREENGEARYPIPICWQNTYTNDEAGWAAYSAWFAESKRKSGGNRLEILDLDAAVRADKEIDRAGWKKAKGDHREFPPVAWYDVVSVQARNPGVWTELGARFPSPDISANGSRRLQDGDLELCEYDKKFIPHVRVKTSLRRPDEDDDRKVYCGICGKWYLIKTNTARYVDGHWKSCTGRTKPDDGRETRVMKWEEMAKEKQWMLWLLYHIRHGSPFTTICDPEFTNWIFGEGWLRGHSRRAAVPQMCQLSDALREDFKAKLQSALFIGVEWDVQQAISGDHNLAICAHMLTAEGKWQFVCLAIVQILEGKATAERTFALLVAVFRQMDLPFCNSTGSDADSVEKKVGTVLLPTLEWLPKPGLQCIPRHCLCLAHEFDTIVEAFLGPMRAFLSQNKYLVNRLNRTPGWLTWVKKCRVMGLASAIKNIADEMVTTQSAGGRRLSDDQLEKIHVQARATAMARIKDVTERDREQCASDQSALSSLDTITDGYIKVSAALVRWRAGPSVRGVRSLRSVTEVRFLSHFPQIDALLALKDMIEGFVGRCAEEEVAKCEKEIENLDVKIGKQTDAAKIEVLEGKKARLEEAKADAQGVVTRLIWGDNPGLEPGADEDEGAGEVAVPVRRPPPDAAPPAGTRLFKDMKIEVPDPALADELAALDDQEIDGEGETPDDGSAGDIELPPGFLAGVEERAREILAQDELAERAAPRATAPRTPLDNGDLPADERAKGAETIANALGRILTPQWWANVKWVRDTLGELQRSLKKLDSDYPAKAGYALLLQKKLYGLMKNLDKGGTESACVQVCAKSGLAKWWFIRKERAAQQFAILAAHILAIVGWQPRLPDPQQPDAFPAHDDLMRVHLQLREELVQLSLTEKGAENAGTRAVEGDDDQDALGIVSEYHGQTAARTLVDEYDHFLEIKRRANLEAPQTLTKYVWRPLDWWIEHLHEFPLLTPYVFDIMLHLVTSCSTERFFSKLTWLLSARRRSLELRNLSAQAMVNVNIQLALDHVFGPSVFKLEKNVTYDDLEASLAKARRPDGGFAYDGFERFLLQARQQHREVLAAE
jgi:hypothetical protein